MGYLSIFYAYNSNHQPTPFHHFHIQSKIDFITDILNSFTLKIYSFSIQKHFPSIFINTTETLPQFVHSTFAANRSDFAYLFFF